jgi:N-acetylmuramoyl-L-alanine amidase
VARILLDPGHGLDKTGTYQRPLMDCTSGKAIIVPNGMKPHPNDHKAGFYREDFGTLAIALEAKLELEALGHTVYLTRNDHRDCAQYLGDRSTNQWRKAYWQGWKWTTEYIKEIEADIFVSIHTNAGGGTGTCGFWSESHNGVELCNSVCTEIANQFKLKVRRIEQHRYLILRDSCNGSTALIECLFHDHFDDVKMILTQQGIEAMGKAIARGINTHAKTI